jgi:hypothetical protein
MPKFLAKSSAQAFICFAVVLVSLGVTGSTVQAADNDILFTAELNAAGETWVVDSPATGILELWLERETLRIKWKLTYQNLTSNPTKVGLFGPEVVGFNAPLQIEFGQNLISPIEGEAVLNDGQFQYLITTRMYVNILTERYKEGEIRGHLRRTLTQAELESQS